MFRLSVSFVIAILAAHCASGIFLGGSLIFRPIKNASEICSGVCNDAPKLWFAGSSTHRKILCEICKSKVTAFPFVFSQAEHSTTPKQNITATTTIKPATTSSNSQDSSSAATTASSGSLNSQSSSPAATTASSGSSNSQSSSPASTTASSSSSNSQDSSTTAASSPDNVTASSPSNTSEDNVTPTEEFTNEAP